MLDAWLAVAMEVELMEQTGADVTTQIARTEWHKSAKGRWSLSLGARGCRVRVFQREPGGVFYRVTWIPRQGRTQASLETTSRREARRRAEAFLRALVEADAPPAPKPLTLDMLWTRYQEDCPAYRENTARTRAEKAARVELLRLGLGGRTLVKRLTLDDVERYSALRRRGTGWPDGRKTGAVGERSIAYDLQVLRAMIRWACTVRLPRGEEWLLAENPLRGLTLPKERNPRRPIATYDRFVTVRVEVQELATAARTERERTRWIRLEMALVLAEATGRRIGAIAGLRWSDIDFAASEITWRPEFDKRRQLSVVPMLSELAEELKRFRAQLGAFGDGWLFPQATKDRPVRSEVLSDLLRTAETAAKVEKLAGGLWHPYRRKWATERRSLPAVDVMKAGGWADRTTMETCYQQATDAGVLEAMKAPERLRDRKSGTE